MKMLYFVPFRIKLCISILYYFIIPLLFIINSLCPSLLTSFTARSRVNSSIKLLMLLMMDLLLMQFRLPELWLSVLFLIVFHQELPVNIHWYLRICHWCMENICDQFMNITPFFFTKVLTRELHFPDILFEFLRDFFVLI